MKKNFMKVLITVMIIIVAGALSCKNRGESKSAKQLSLPELKDMEQRIEENVYPLPTSAEVIKRLTDLELGYIIGATNPHTSASSYVASYNRSVNLGIYGADLSYVTLYNMQQDVLDYLSAIRTLALDLHLSQVYDESLYERIKVNFDNKDTLVTILTDAFDNTYAYLVEAGQANLALLVVGGAWVEGFALTLAVSELAGHLSGFEATLIDQKRSFDMFEEIASQYSEDLLVARLLEALQPIREVLAPITTSLTMTQIEKMKEVAVKVRAELVK